jgi:hypothetical protein
MACEPIRDDTPHPQVESESAMCARHFDVLDVGTRAVEARLPRDHAVAPRLVRSARPSSQRDRGKISRVVIA